MRKYIILAFSLICTTLSAQISRLARDMEYKAELNGQSGTGDYTPFWQTANRYGLADPDNTSGYLRAGLGRDIKADSLRNWRIGYGADLVVPFGYTSHFIVQQLYADFQYKNIGLSVGQKERAAELKNARLSSGGMTLGTNARPLPQVRLDFFPNFTVIPRTKDWIALKGHLAYGCYTDNKWQREFNRGNHKTVYTANSLYHSKAGYLRIGNLEKFPVVLTGGCEMVCQFGGTVWNRGIPGQNPDGSFKMESGLKQMFQAFIPSGSDVTDGNNPNATGNHLGSYLARIDYHGKGWKASFYGEHFFEDHSQLGWDFAWKDMTYGAELQLPENRFVSTLLYEHIRTTDQSGPVFVNVSNHVRPIGGVDCYYAHGIYGAYQHAGFVLGNPLLTSPIFNVNGDGTDGLYGAGSINCPDNRILASHFGISGHPHQDLSYRILFTHEKSYGTYDKPYDNPRYGNFLLVEATYTPRRIQGLGITASYGQNGGTLLGRSKGAMLSVSYRGKVRKDK